MPKSAPLTCHNNAAYAKHLPLISAEFFIRLQTIQICNRSVTGGLVEIEVVAKVQHPLTDNGPVLRPGFFMDEI